MTLTADLGTSTSFTSVRPGPVMSRVRPRDAAGREFACTECFGPLEVAYDFGDVTAASIEAGPKSIWRYRHCCPCPPTSADHPNTEPGLTRLIKADRLARRWASATCG
jgi:threonine synthase